MTGPLPPRVCLVDLSSGSVGRSALPEQWVTTYLGGKGLGARYLYDAVNPTINPLDPANELLFVPGPLTGYLPDGGRCPVVTKSPLTGLFLDSYVGGNLGTSLRAALPDCAGLAVRGAAESTTVLDLRDGTGSLSKQPDLAGATNDEVAERFPDDLVVSIGPAGEHEVAIATIATDGGDHHAGRGGAGAVMGSKGLKAIVIPECTALDAPAAIEALVARRTAAFGESAYGRSYRASGTLETVDIADVTGMLPTRGWQDTRFDGAEGIGIAAVRDAATGREHEDGELPGDFRIATDGYEMVMRGGTPIALGAGLGIDDIDVVATLGARCDQLGVDVISAGNLIALATLAVEAGTLDRDLAFGDKTGPASLLEEIAHRSSSLGDTLAEGVAAAGEHLDVTQQVPTVKAMAVPSFDARGLPAMALAFATSDRGACHRRAIPATVEAAKPAWTNTQIARLLVEEQDRRSVLWSLVVDDVTAPLVTEYGMDWLSALGFDLRERELKQCGERIWTLTRLFNVREGIDRSDDVLPAVFRENGLSERRFDRLLDRYYETREWDANGLPSRRLLERLDLIDELDPHTLIGGHPLHSA